MLREVAVNVDLAEPDVLWSDSGEQTGVACKKIYSEKNADKSIQDAVRQIEGSTKYGFVAIKLG